MLICASVTHRTAPFAIRERLHLDPVTRSGLARHLIATALVQEMSWLITCNRVEVYAEVLATAPVVAWSRFATGLRRVTAHDGWAETFLVHARPLIAGAAARHLLRVSAGLESSVPGDDHVAGQVREAYRLAVEAGTVGSVLHRLHQQALHVGRRARALHSLGEVPPSHGQRAVELIGRRVPPAEGLLILGAGHAARGVARRAQRLGLGPLVVANRSPDLADRLAAEVGGRTAAWEDRYTELARAGSAVIAVAGGSVVVRPEALARARETASAPLVLVDLSMPRVVEPAIAHLPGVSLWNLDDLDRTAERVSHSAAPQIAVRRLVAEAVARLGVSGAVVSGNFRVERARVG